MVGCILGFIGLLYGVGMVAILIIAFYKLVENK
jgi:hypothetical protein